MGELWDETMLQDLNLTWHRLNSKNICLFVIFDELTIISNQDLLDTIEGPQRAQETSRPRRSF